MVRLTKSAVIDPPIVAQPDVDSEPQLAPEFEWNAVVPQPAVGGGEQSPVVGQNPEKDLGIDSQLVLASAGLAASAQTPAIADGDALYGELVGGSNKVAVTTSVKDLIEAIGPKQLQRVPQLQRLLHFAERANAGVEVEFPIPDEASLANPLALGKALQEASFAVKLPTDEGGRQLKLIWTPAKGDEGFAVKVVEKSDNKIGPLSDYVAAEAGFKFSNLSWEKAQRAIGVFTNGTAPGDIPAALAQATELDAVEAEITTKVKTKALTHPILKTLERVAPHPLVRGVARIMQVGSVEFKHGEKIELSPGTVGADGEVTGEGGRPTQLEQAASGEVPLILARPDGAGIVFDGNSLTRGIFQAMTSAGMARQDLDHSTRFYSGADSDDVIDLVTRPELTNINFGQTAVARGAVEQQLASGTTLWQLSAVSPDRNHGHHLLELGNSFNRIAREYGFTEEGTYAELLQRRGGTTSGGRQVGQQEYQHQEYLTAVPNSDAALTMLQELRKTLSPEEYQKIREELVNPYFNFGDEQLEAMNQQRFGANYAANRPEYAEVKQQFYGDTAHKGQVADIYWFYRQPDGTRIHTAHEGAGPFDPNGGMF